MAAYDPRRKAKPIGWLGHFCVLNKGEEAFVNAKKVFDEGPRPPAMQGHDTFLSWLESAVGVANQFCLDLMSQSVPNCPPMTVERLHREVKFNQDSDPAHVRYKQAMAARRANR